MKFCDTPLCASSISPPVVEMDLEWQHSGVYHKAGCLVWDTGAAAEELRYYNAAFAIMLGNMPFSREDGTCGGAPAGRKAGTRTSR